jgi:hypothetical protein
MIATIGWIGAAFCVASLVQQNQIRFRALNLAACLVLCAFNVANQAWSGVLLNAIIAVINIRQLCLLGASARAELRPDRPFDVVDDLDLALATTG